MSEWRRLLLQPSRATKTTMFKEMHKKPFISSSTRKDVRGWECLIFRAEPSSINKLQCETGEETKVTIHTQKKEQLRCEIVIGKKNACAIIKFARLTTCGSCAAVEIASQITPLIEKYQMQWDNNITTNKNWQCPTCFQRRDEMWEELLTPRWKRSNPASMMDSRMTSVTSRLMKKFLQIWTFVIAQELAAGTHTARICWWIRQDCQRIESDHLL